MPFDRRFPLLDGPGEAGGGATGPPGPPEESPRPLPGANQIEKLTLLTAGMGRPVPLAYGRHLVGGIRIFEHELTATSQTVIFQALGEGELDLPETILINGIPYDISGPQILNSAGAVVGHFHPGLEGELGIETDPAVRNQKICSLWPAGFRPQLTWSRSAYLAFKLPLDVNAPDKGFDIRGVFRTARVRDFNASGFTGYGYSSNPARIALDILLRRFLFPHGLINETVPSAVTARLDFAAWNAWKTACDTDIGGGVLRWEAHPAFVDQSDLLRALEWLLFLGRGYLLQRDAKYAAFHDEARSPLATLTRDHFRLGSYALKEKSARQLANQFSLRFRNLQSGLGPGTISTTGTSVTGTGTEFTRWFKPDHALQPASGAQAHVVRRINAVTNDTVMTLYNAFGADLPGGTPYRNASFDFQPAVKVVDDEGLQDEVGRVIASELELGNNTFERAERLGNFLKARTLDMNRQLQAVVLDELDGLQDLLPGDALTAFDSLDFLSNLKYEILEISEEPDGHTREVFLQELDDAIFSDLAGPQPVFVPTFIP